MNTKQRVFVEEYLQCWSATEAARRAGYAHPNTQGPRLLVNVGISETIKTRLKEKQMGADEALILLAEQARANLGDFFRLVEQWVYRPAPTEEIIDRTEEVVNDPDSDKPIIKTKYLVRQVVLDMKKLVDPRYSHLLKKFVDSPRSGLSIEIFDKQTAIDKVLRVEGKYNDKIDVTSGGEKLDLNVWIKERQSRLEQVESMDSDGDES